MSAKSIPAMEAAVRLQQPYRRLIDWITTQKLKGERVDGRWFANERDVERLRRELRETAGAAAR